MKKMTLTKTMTLDFRKAVFISDTLRAHGQVVEITDTNEVIVEGTIHNGKGEPCVSSRGVFALLDARTGIRMGILDETDTHRFLKTVFEAKASPEAADTP
jgi:acyl-CoA thioesterase FadM